MKEHEGKMADRSTNHAQNLRRFSVQDYPDIGCEMSDNRFNDTTSMDRWFLVWQLSGVTLCR